MRTLPFRPTLLCTVLFGALVLSGPAVAQEPDVRIRLHPSDVSGVEDVVRLEITVDAGGARQPPTPQAAFEPFNLEVIAGPAQSTSFRFINGAASASQSLTWHLRPLAPGPAGVRDVEVRVGQTIVRPEDATIEIVEGTLERPRQRRSPFDALGADPRDPFGRSPLDDLFERRRRPRRAPPDPEIYLEAEVTPKDPVVGEQVLYTLYLYTDVTVRSIDPSGLPDFEGFWVTVIPQPDRPRQEEIVHKGRRITRVPLLQRALFPRRAGTVTISPLEAHLLAEVPDNSPFGALLPRTAQLERKTDPVEVRVRETPEPRPEGFQGAVGRLQVDAWLEPTRLAMGDAATLTLRLHGQGHLQGLPAPQIPEIPGLRIFPPQQQSDQTVHGTQVQGDRTWNWVVVPERPGTFELPALELPYWDPSRDDWRTARAEISSLRVDGTTKLTAADGQTLELRSIRSAALPAPGGSVASGSLGYWLFGLPWLATFLLLGLGGRRSPGSRNARRHLVQRLREAENEDRPRLVAAGVEDAWREFLVERHEIPPGTPSTRWAEILTAHGVPEGDAKALVQLADDLHYLRYAPKLSSVGDLQRELLERSRKLARTLS